MKNSFFYLSSLIHQSVGANEPFNFNLFLRTKESCCSPVLSQLMHNQLPTVLQAGCQMCPLCQATRHTPPGFYSFTFTPINWINWAIQPLDNVIVFKKGGFYGVIRLSQSIWIRGFTNKTGFDGRWKICRKIPAYCFVEKRRKIAFLESIDIRRFEY